MKTITIVAVLLVAKASWTAEKKGSTWPKNKVTLSDSFLPAVTQVLTYLLDKIDELDNPLEGPEVIQVVLLAPPPSTASTTNSVTILNTTTADGTPTTTRTIVVESEELVKGSDDLKDPTLGLPRPGGMQSRPSVVEIILGRLRDILAHEAKRQGFAKIQGYSRTVLDVLAKSSQLTSVEQLTMLVELMMKNKNIHRRDSLAQASLVLEGLKKPGGPLQKTLANIPPLKFTL